MKEIKWSLITIGVWKSRISLRIKEKFFPAFPAGGGSSLGYKLAGFDVIGCNEIDNKMIENYKANLNPRYAFNMPIQDFKNLKELPEDLFNLDILDGSPPCSSFSLSGNREKDWGKKKKFREGQQDQVLDTLFFDFIDLANRLKPKVVIAENVVGITKGQAKNYFKKILSDFDKIGYYCQAFILDSSRMGVPQKRERVFFISLRKDLAGPFLYDKDIFSKAPLLKLDFNGSYIPYKEIRENQAEPEDFKIGPKIKGYWKLVKPGNSFSSVHPTGSYFNEIKLHPEKVCPTIRASGLPYDHLEPRKISKKELLKIGTFPMDYIFKGVSPNYIVGMSVPPIMVAQIAKEVYDQWLSKL